MSRQAFLRVTADPSNFHAVGRVWGWPCFPPAGRGGGGKNGARSLSSSLPLTRLVIDPCENFSHSGGR